MSSVSLPSITVSENRRFLATESRQPFFWLGDTAWELFHRLDRQEAKLFFATRQRQRFNVIQAVALAEFDGLTVPNAYGELPLIDLDPQRPNEAYFRLVDEYIDLAAQHELYIGLLPTWGDKVTQMWGAGPQVFDEQNAHTFGRYLGQRYGARSNVLWILGGDRPPVFEAGVYKNATEAGDHRPIWRAMAAGIDAVTDGKRFMTFHPPGGRSTSQWLNAEEWLDMHMMQSGHGGNRDIPVWEMIERDYALAPTRPTLDAEPNYEDHPVNPWPTWQPAQGYYRDYDVRKQLYRSVFAGGCGVTYGHHAVWQFFNAESHPVVNHADRPWPEAIERLGANQVQHLRALIESRPFFSRVPNQSLLVSSHPARDEHVRATSDAEGHYAFVYLPSPLPVTVDLSQISGQRVRACWFNPRNGSANAIGDFTTGGAQTFFPPVDGPDWVLVLDDVGQEYGVPGKR